MQKNLSDTDATVRYVLAIVLAAGAVGGYLLLEGTTALWVTAIAVALAAVMAVTAAYRTCPLYRLVDFSTLRRKGKGA